MNNFIKFEKTITWIIRALIAGCGGLYCTGKGVFIVLAYQSAAGLYWISAATFLYVLCFICAISAYRVKIKKEVK